MSHIETPKPLLETLETLGQICEHELALRPQGEYTNHTMFQRLVLDDNYGPDHLEMTERIQVVEERFQTVIQTERDLSLPIDGVRSLENSLSFVLFSRKSLYKYLESSLMAECHIEYLEAINRLL